MHKKQFTRTIKNFSLGLIPFLAVLIVWIIFYYEKINLRWFIPSPAESVLSLLKLTADGTILQLVMASLTNLVPPFIMAAICAIAFGTLMGLNKSAYSVFNPTLAAFYPIPSLAWLPFIILFLGFTREAIWAIIFISCFLRVVYSVISGIQNINIEYILAAKNLGLSKIKIIFEVALPCAFPQIITGLRLGFGSAWRSLIGAEMLVATFGGLGKFIWMAQWYFDFDKAIAGVLVISVISIVIEKFIFGRLENSVFTKWGLVPEQ